MLNYIYTPGGVTRTDVIRHFLSRIVTTRYNRSTRQARGRSADTERDARARALPCHPLSRMKGAGVAGVGCTVQEVFHDTSYAY